MPSEALITSHLGSLLRSRSLGLALFHRSSLLASQLPPPHGEMAVPLPCSNASEGSPLSPAPHVLHRNFTFKTLCSSNLTVFLAAKLLFQFTSRNIPPFWVLPNTLTPPQPFTHVCKKHSHTHTPPLGSLRFSLSISSTGSLPLTLAHC